MPECSAAISIPTIYLHRVRTHDLKIMTVHFMPLIKMSALTTQLSLTLKYADFVLNIQWHTSVPQNTTSHDAQKLICHCLLTVLPPKTKFLFKHIYYVFFNLFIVVTCDVDSSQQYECGGGIEAEGQCVSQDCCWNPVPDEGKPYCFHKRDGMLE